MPKNANKHRTTVNWKDAKFTTYSLQGKPQRDLSWCNLSWDDATGSGLFLIRFAPGSISIPHEHLAREEFVLLEGDLEDNDGHIYRTGDCVSLAPGSRHFTRSRTGAISAVFVHGGFRTLDAAEVPKGVFTHAPEKLAKPARAAAAGTKRATRSNGRKST
jgi:quercetin dioxygenase-like cupin family protein